MGGLLGATVSSMLVYVNRLGDSIIGGDWPSGLSGLCLRSRGRGLTCVSALGCIRTGEDVNGAERLSGPRGVSTVSSRLGIRGVPGDMGISGRSERGRGAWKLESPVMDL